MKLSEYAKRHSISYRTAHRHWKQGFIKGSQLASGTIVVEEESTPVLATKQRAVLYARVSSSENKANVETQLERLRGYASAKGYTIVREVKEIGSGLDNKRPLLEKILLWDAWDIVLVEHKDRLARFGVNYLEVLLEKQGKTIEVINNVQDNAMETMADDLMQDFVAIITSFTARLYGLRRSQRKTEAIIKELHENE